MLLTYVHRYPVDYRYILYVILWMEEILQQIVDNLSRQSPTSSAAPWQRLERSERSEPGPCGSAGPGGGIRASHGQNHGWWMILRGESL